MPLDDPPSDEPPPDCPPALGISSQYPLLFQRRPGCFSHSSRRCLSCSFAISLLIWFNSFCCFSNAPFSISISDERRLLLLACAIFTPTPTAVRPIVDIPAIIQPCFLPSHFSSCSIFSCFSCNRRRTCALIATPCASLMPTPITANSPTNDIVFFILVFLLL